MSREETEAGRLRPAYPAGSGSTKAQSWGGAWREQLWRSSSRTEVSSHKLVWVPQVVFNLQQPWCPRVRAVTPSRYRSQRSVWLLQVSAPNKPQ